MAGNQPTGGQARQRSQATTRRRLLDAAAALFALHGSSTTTIQMVAREAGIAAGTVYLHFADKDTLLQAVLAEALGELKSCLAGAASTRTARTAAQDVRQRTEGLVRFADEHRDLAAVLFDPANLGTPAGADTLAFLVASQAAGLAEDRGRGWVRREVDEEIAARALVGSLMLVLHWWIGQGGSNGQPAAASRLIDQLAGLRLHGTGTPARA
ncbi:MAG: TetR/AcrR family transcriptional regulator [bacterium]|nr:TetR/AcrR family transcriptional regulator [bacterium]